MDAPDEEKRACQVAKETPEPAVLSHVSWLKRYAKLSKAYAVSAMWQVKLEIIRAGKPSKFNRASGASSGITSPRCREKLLTNFLPLAVWCTCPQKMQLP